MTARHDISLRQGNSFRRTFRFKGFDGAPINLTGSTVTMTIATPITPLVFSTATGGLTVTSAATGEVALSLQAADTALLPPMVLPYEIERAIFDAATGQSDEATILTGSIIVQRGMIDA